MLFWIKISFILAIRLISKITHDSTNFYMWKATENTKKKGIKKNNLKKTNSLVTSWGRFSFAYSWIFTQFFDLIFIWVPNSSIVMLSSAIWSCRESDLHSNYEQFFCSFHFYLFYNLFSLCTNNYEGYTMFRLASWLIVGWNIGLISFKQMGNYLPIVVIGNLKKYGRVLRVC